MTDIRKFAADPMAFFDALIFPSAFGAKPFKEVMADHQRKWFEAISPSLVAIAADQKPPTGRFWTERTKGGSKDTDSACVLLWLLAFSRRKLDMQVGAADKDQAGEVKKAASDFLRLNPWLASRVESQAWSLKCEATGSECSIIAADVAGSHGARPDVVLMNELSHVTKEEFSQNLLDNASKKPHGLVIVATNAGFQNSWQHSWRKIAQTSDRWHFHQFSQPAPWVDDAELEEARRRNSNSRYRRLWWGEWVSGAGDALDSSDITAAVNPSLRPILKPLKNWFFIGGLDLGIKQDHSAFVVIAGNRESLQLRLAHAKSWAPDSITGKVDLMAVEQEILSIHKRLKLTRVGYDPYQAALMAQRLQLQKVKMHEVPFTGNNLNQMASTLLDVFRSRRIELFNEPKLIADLSRLTIEEKSYGHRLSATRDANGHADLATALAIALPVSVDNVGKPNKRFGAVTDKSCSLTPFQRHLRRLEAQQREFDMVAAGGDDRDGKEIWKLIMRGMGRM